MAEGETIQCTSGDSIPSIAKNTGFFWKTLWNHPENAALKKKRDNPNVLYPGDDVFIPELKKKTEAKGSDATHKFRRKGEPIKISMKLFKSDGKPRANEPYSLVLGVKEVKGNTDGDGVINASIPNDLKEGMLKLKDGKEVMPLAIGGLDPVDEVSGVQHRLNNLGFDCSNSGEIDEATERAITNFQSQNKLDVSGKIDDATKKKILSFGQ